MFNNKETGWKRTEELNKGGPKKMAEVEAEVIEKLQKEHSERKRDDDRRGGRGGDRGGNQRGGRDGRDNRRYNDREQKYQVKGQGEDGKMEKQYSTKSNRSDHPNMEKQ
jgi:hypothetical protein